MLGTWTLWRNREGSAQAMMSHEASRFFWVRLNRLTGKGGNSKACVPMFTGSNMHIQTRGTNTKKDEGPGSVLTLFLMFLTGMHPNTLFHFVFALS